MAAQSSPADALFNTMFQPAERALPLALRSALAALAHYPHEAALHDVAVTRMLHVLVSRTRRCALLVELPAWRELRDTVAAEMAEGHHLSRISTKLQRRLVAAIVGAEVREHARRCWDDERDGGAAPEDAAQLSSKAAAARNAQLCFVRGLLQDALQLVGSFEEAEGKEATHAVAALTGQAHMVRERRPELLALKHCHL